VPIALPVAPEANELLSRNALALLIGMLLDQQVPLERAFSAPFDLVTRLGHEPTAEELSEFNPDELVRIFSERPALHRYPKAMAGRVQALAHLIVAQYGGDAAALWSTASSGAELLKRVSALPGFGAVKAQIFVALLGKQLGVRPPGWQEAAGPFGAEGSYVSVADITDEDSLAQVRAYKQAMKAAAKAAGDLWCRYGLAMNARQQLARVVPLAVLVLLAAVGLRGEVAGPRWDGPLRAYGVPIGIGIEIICAVLLILTYYRDHLARRRQLEFLRAQATARTQGRSAPDADAPDPDADDRDVAQSLRLHLRVLLGMALISVAVALLLNLHLHYFRGVPRKVILKIPTARPSNNRLPPSPQLAVSAAVLHFLLYGLLIVALLAALAVSLWWARRLTLSVALPGLLGDAGDAESEGLREAVASGRAAMTDLDDARAAIIACYEAMERSLAERGFARGAAGTPDELLRRAIDRNIIRGAAARRLTGLFYEARFSSHELGADKRVAAVAALDELASELDVVAL
jgi:uncharacterized HhH-GPD family protein